MNKSATRLALLLCIVASPVSVQGFGLSPPSLPSSASGLATPFIWRPPTLRWAPSSSSPRSRPSSRPAFPARCMAKTFGDNVEGEWIGFESEFGTSDGACRNVPDYQMPESLLDWGVVLTGYEHLTSTAVVDGKLKIRRTRLLPAVGCAIDSVPYDLYEKESEVGDDSTGAFFEDGSFSVGPHKLGGVGNAARWIICVTREDDDGGAKRRVQVEGSPGSSTVRVFWEQRHGDYKAGTDYWETFRDPQCLKIMDALKPAEGSGGLGKNKDSVLLPGGVSVSQHGGESNADGGEYRVEVRVEGGGGIAREYIGGVLKQVVKIE